MSRMYKFSFFSLALAAIGLLMVEWDTGQASSHREAPMIVADPLADNTDVYAFVSPTDSTMVNLVMNVIPFQEPSGGPNFYRFGNHVLYEMNVDNDGDAIPEIVYEIRFETEIQNGETFLYNTGELTSIDDADYNFRQTYSVTRVDSTTGMSTVLTDGVLVPPDYVGQHSIPNYGSLAAMGIYDLSEGGRVFVGQRDDPFFIDLGAVFDLLTIRPGPPGGNTGGGIDGVGGFNVSSMVLEIPIENLTADNQPLTGPSDADAVIGVWATTNRKSTKVLNGDGTASYSGDWVQVSRLGLPLINEAIVPLAFKDFWNSSMPRNDVENFVAPFGDDGPVTNPELAQLLEAFYGVDVPEPPRDDLVNALGRGIEGLNRPENVTAAFMLRLNMAFTAKRPGTEGFSIYGVLGGDLSGFPNGRRLYDDVHDVSLRLIAGVLVDGFDMAPNNVLGDGVPSNDKQFLLTFPYVAPPHSGYLHEHHPVGQAPVFTTIEEGGTPQSFGLLQNYPNPFDPNTRIEYRIGEASNVTVKVFDVTGREVTTLVNERKAPGTYTLRWDGTNSTGQQVASGVYIYRLVAGDNTKARTMVRIK